MILHYLLVLIWCQVLVTSFDTRMCTVQDHINLTAREFCCNVMIEKFDDKYRNPEDLYLTKFLTALKMELFAVWKALQLSWRLCDMFHKGSLWNTLWCKKKYKKNCKGHLKFTPNTENNTSISDFTMQELRDSCFQISMYENSKAENYIEIIQELTTFWQTDLGRF